MKSLLPAAALIAGLTVTAAFAATQTMNAIPADSQTVTDFYKQSVYDTSKNKIGSVDDVLIDKQGKVTALMVGVGGFLGMGEKDVAVPFAAVKAEKKDNSWYLTLDESKDALKAAPGFKYDRTKTSWLSDKSDKTTGSDTSKK
jgi:sporulation protein YlmC with PRC-barrel domain